MHATARYTVRYGAGLDFAGRDLRPARLTVATRHGKVPVHVYGKDGLPVYVHLHGGAWMMRFPQMDDWWCRYLAAEAGVQVLNVDFRTAPYVTYPVSHEQAFDVAVARRAAVIGGFSSGGGMAAAVALMARDTGALDLTLQVLGVPALDMATEKPPSHGMISGELRALVRRVYFPDVVRRSEPYASPVLAEDLSGLPPAVVLTAERDSLRPDGDRYAERLREAGVEVLHDVTPGADHYFLTQDQPRARHTMALVAAEVRRRTS
ncbi:MAG: alpha/beta hydrolase [Frankiales bacterium]|nr:alpha/beta hydrolase [Frankiales bacterium]